MPRISAPINGYLILKPTEEAVVRFLKAHGQKGASISEIARGINLARTSIYNATDALRKKNIIEKHGFRHALSSEQSNLRANRPTTAKESVIDLLQELLSLKKGEIIYTIESDEDIRLLFETEAGLPKWQKQAADKGIVLKSIGSIKMLHYFRSKMDNTLKTAIKRRSGSARFMTDKIPGSRTLVSFRDSVIFFSRRENVFYRIDDAETAHFIQSIIEALYLRLQPHPLIIN